MAAEMVGGTVSSGSPQKLVSPIYTLTRLYGALAARSAMEANMNPTFLTEQEAARLLRLSERTLQRWRVEPPSSEPLPFIRAGRRILYDREALLAWLRARTASCTAEADVA